MHDNQFLILLAPSLGALILAIAGYVQSLANGKLTREVNAKVDGQFTKARAETEEAVRKLDVLRGQVDRGETSIVPETATEVIETARIKAAKLLEVAAVAANLILKDAEATAERLGPAKMKAAALDAIGTAVDNETARAAPIAEVRRRDEHHA